MTSRIFPSVNFDGYQLQYYFGCKGKRSNKKKKKKKRLKKFALLAEVRDNKFKIRLNLKIPV